ncbi:hypothetical protein FHS19_003027 [Paenibacillus rhizosphaerae]|uniref:Uncharacterized protein n=1 Tax=Paenibacillus rhizosphaerae TaxID=297318 RepID=A0A839TPF0_9BACL|nr:hypothetical protein [Paenibacillus rhizosphaerae]
MLMYTFEEKESFNVLGIGTELKKNTESSNSLRGNTSSLKARGSQLMS